MDRDDVFVQLDLYTSKSNFTAILITFDEPVIEQELENHLVLKKTRLALNITSSRPASAPEVADLAEFIAEDQPALLNLLGSDIICPNSAESAKDVIGKGHHFILFVSITYVMIDDRDCFDARDLPLRSA